MKKAILLICFGNLNITKQLYKLKEKLNINFLNYDVYTCFTSKFFIKKYGYNIEKVLYNIYINKYEKLLCLPLFTIDGIEYNNSIFHINKYKNYLKSIKLAYPLLYSKEDFISIYKFIQKYYEENLIYICHGTDDKSNFRYQKLFNMFENKNIYFANLENRPYIEETINTLKKNYINNICVKPFLLFDGKHIKNDISYNIKNELIKNNINVKINATPLLQYNEIIDIFIQHLKESKAI